MRKVLQSCHYLSFCSNNSSLYYLPKISKRTSTYRDFDRPTYSKLLCNVVKILAQPEIFWLGSIQTVLINHFSGIITAMKKNG